ncbi:MAG: hypothetical protein H6656_00365 [Ardenticatenaceae bacterium]|nr:hypothetical protein [Anaerolineales bacterium]MCB9005837.1 hypothetical protein [Ardenticatenaceae bacterium]
MKTRTILRIRDGDEHKRSLLLFVESTKKEIESIRMAAYSDRLFKNPLINLFNQYIRMVNSFYSKYRAHAQNETDEKKLPQQMHKAIMKLATEWDYIFRLSSVARARGRELKWLRPVIRQAISDLGLDINSFVVLPHFGHEFMLTR